MLATLVADISPLRPLLHRDRPPLGSLFSAERLQPGFFATLLEGQS